MRARWAIVVVALGVIGAGCKRRPADGSAWAKRTLGPGAEGLLAEAGSAGPMLGPSKEMPPCAPRPLVVVEEVPVSPGAEAVELRWSALNTLLPVGVVATQAGDIKSLVKIRRDVNREQIGTYTFKGRTHQKTRDLPLFLLTTILRGDGSKGFQIVEGQDDADLAKAITELPEICPGR